MLDQLGSFCNYAISKIQTLIDANYIFCKQPNTLTYIAKLPKKGKFLYDNIENMSNQTHYYKGFHIYRLINYI